MLRALLFLGVVTLLSLGAIWLANRPGEVVIHWLGYRIETSFAFLLTISALTFIIGLAAYRLIFRILLAPKNITNYLQVRQDKLGIEAVTQAFAALTMGDTNAAARHIKVAERNLGKSPLLLMLAAQQSRIEGNEPQTLLYLEQLLDYKETAFLAARGLTDHARKHGDVTSAITYAEKANHLTPNNRWVMLALIDLYSRQGRWQEALLIVDKAYKRNTINANERKEFTALIHYAQGKKLLDEKKSEMAQRFLEQAHQKQPGFIPAAASLARVLLEQGKPDAASKVIRTTWKTQPHPELAEIYLNLMPAESPAKTLARAQKLASVHSDHSESQALVAQAAIAAKDWTTARNYLKLGLNKQKTARLSRLMAEVEQGQHQDKQASAEWMLRAASADNDPTWVCSHCSDTHEEWHTHCPTCHTFHSVQWKVPMLRYMPAAEAS